MNKICRFCQSSRVFLLFGPTQNPAHKEAYEFACTNAGFGVHGPIVKCPDCGMIYVDEQITQKKISTYYEIAEDPLYLEEQPAREITFRNYLAKLEKRYPKKGKLLDVGTNTGLFVYVAQKNGWEAIGLEPNRWGVNYARKAYGLKLVEKPFVKGVFPEKSFDAVTMWDVIEHFIDPPAEMEKVFWYLKPGGVFAFSTVDPESQLARAMGTKWSWYMEMHRVLLSRPAAKHYLERAGFKNITFRPHFRHLSAGYLATRLRAVSKPLSQAAQKILIATGLEKKIVPYYANDLYDCYAFKG